MTTISFRGLLAATATAAILAVSSAHAADAPAPKLSAAVQKQLAVAQKASGTQDWAAAKAAIDAATQIAGRTDYDNYMIATFGVFINNSMNDKNAASIAAMAAADSPAQPDADKAKNLRNVVSLLMQTKQFDKAVPYAKTLMASNPDLQTQVAIGQAFYFGKDYQDAIATEQKVIDATVAGGKKPDRNTLEIMLNAQVAIKDEAGAEKTLETLVADYNDPRDWTQMIDVAFSTKGLRDLDADWLGRLLFVSGGDVSASDASMIGVTASHLGMLGDAQVAQQHGGTGFTDPKAAADKDKQTIKAQIAAGQKANGQYNVKLAEALYSYGMYPEAEAAARLGMQKGGATDSSEGPMVLGQSLVAQGKYDDAVAAFGQVTGGGPATPRIVRLWVAYANIKKNPPAPAAP